EDMWQLVGAESRGILQKIWDQSIPLEQFIDVKLYSGIKTAANDVYEISETTKNQMIASDSKSQTIIRNWIRGRDVKRWMVNSADLYLIALRNSGDSSVTHSWSKAQTEETALRAFISGLPAIHEYLSQFEEKLRNRSDQGRWWWELRPC